MRPARALLALLLSIQLAAPAVSAQPAEKKEEASKKSDKKSDKKAAKKKKDEAAKDQGEGEDAKPAADADVTAPPAIPPLAESLTGMAKAEYEAGKVLFLDGDFNGAKLKFDQVYELSKDARVLWNVAAAEKNLRHYAKTVIALKRYLEEGGDKLTEQDRTDAGALIEAMSAFVASVSITVDQPDAEIRIDDELVGKSPLSGPVLVDQGNRLVRVDKDGFKPYAQTKKVAGGGQLTLELALVAIVHEGRLRVVAGPSDTISIDGRVVGKGTWEGVLASGAHSLSVTGTGKRPYQTDVVVSDDQLTTSRVALEAEQRDAPVGFFATPWPWVIGGAVVAASAGVGAYFLFRPEDEGPPPTVTGTLGEVPLQLGARGAARGWRF